MEQRTVAVASPRGEEVPLFMQTMDSIIRLLNFRMSARRLSRLPRPVCKVLIRTYQSLLTLLPVPPQGQQTRWPVMISLEWRTPREATACADTPSITADPKPAGPYGKP